MMLAETNIPGFSGTSPSDRSLSSLVVEATLSLSCGQSATLPDVRGRTAGCRLGHARLEVADKHSPASCRAALSNGIADQAHKYSSERLSEPCQTRPVRPVVVCHTWHASETEDEILGESGDAPRARASGRRKHPGTKLARRAEHSWSLALSSSSLSSSSSSSSSTSPCSTHLQGVVARCCCKVLGNAAVLCSRPACRWVHRISGALLWRETTPRSGPLFLWIPLHLRLCAWQPCFGNGTGIRWQSEPKEPQEHGTPNTPDGQTHQARFFWP